MIDERLLGKHFQGSCCGLIEMLFIIYFEGLRKIG
jgi:hypothetical protein